MHTIGARSTFTLLCAGVVLALAAASTALDVKENIALVLGLIGLGVILARPIAGLLLFVFLAQTDGLVAGVTGGRSDLVLGGIVVATLAGVVFEAPMRDRSNRWGGNPAAFRLAVLFLLTGLVSAQFAAFPDEATDTLLNLASLIVVFYLIVVLATTRQRVLALLLALCVSTAISGGIAGLEYLGLADVMGSANPGGRNNGATDVANTTAGNFFLVGTLIAAVLAVRMRAWRNVTAAAFLFGAAGNLFSMARSALMLLGAGILWLGVKKRQARYLPAIALLAAVGATAALPFVPDKVWERFSELSDPSSDWTLGRRLGYHVVGVRLLADNPILGVGPGNFADHYVDFDFRWVEGRRIEARRLHNTYLSVAVEYGIIGLAVFAAMIVSVLAGLQRVRRRSRDPALRCIAEAVQFSLAIFLIALASLPGTNYNLLWIVIGIGTAVASLEERGPCAKLDDAGRACTEHAEPSSVHELVTEPADATR